MLSRPCRLSTTRKYSESNMICMVILQDYIHNSKVITTLYLRVINGTTGKMFRNFRFNGRSLNFEQRQNQPVDTSACSHSPPALILRPLPFPACSRSPSGARDVERERRHIFCETFYRLLYSQATEKKKLSVFIIKMAFKSIM